MTATINILKDLVGFATVSRDPNRALIDYVADRLASTNADVRIIPDENGGKANLFATTGPRDRGGVMLSGHTDVVPVDGQEWTVPAFACTETDGRLYGRGTADMKGFVARPACLRGRGRPNSRHRSIWRSHMTKSLAASASAR